LAAPTSEPTAEAFWTDADRHLVRYGMTQAAASATYSAGRRGSVGSLAAFLAEPILSSGGLVWCFLLGPKGT
jgi:4-aminobutyrate aminotransferase-like enzyme